MSYHEIRVRPVVRYIVTSFSCDADYGSQKSVEFGEFDNVDRANIVASALAVTDSIVSPAGQTVVETARRLKIDWTRGPGEPKEAIQWHLSEVDAP